MIFGLPAHDIERAGRTLLGEGHAQHTADADTCAVAFARSVWSRLAEPGDRVAGTLIRALGVIDALSNVVAHTAPERVLERVGESYRAELSAPSATRGKSLGGATVLSDALQRWRPRLVSAEALRACETAGLIDARIVFPEGHGWPDRVDDLGYHSPTALWIRGRYPETVMGPGISMVGSRASTGYGEHITVELASGVAIRGLCVVSGGAYGIDAMAHRSALASGGRTVAVLAGGIDRLYPSGHDVLFDRIQDAGLIVSEMPPGFSPTRWRFLQRNRVIAALGNATLVCEAGSRSGSLNTAGHAASMGRPLGAVPGPITSPSSAGCHRLLREYDAVCVTTVDHAVELAGGDIDPGPLPILDDVSGQLLRMADALRPRRAQSIADLAAATGLSPGDTRAAVAELELMGRARCTERGWCSIGRKTTPGE